MTADLWVKILTSDIQNMKQKYHTLDHVIR